MIVLTEQIEIPASYEKLKAWTANFEEEFVKWSPYHIECNLYNGNYNAGSKIRFREIVMGLDYDVTGTITECEQDENHFRIVFRSDKKTAFITFEGKRTKTGCHFSHTEACGMTTPVIGAIMNFLIFKVFFRKKTPPIGIVPSASPSLKADFTPNRKCRISPFAGVYQAPALPEKVCQLKS